MKTKYKIMIRISHTAPVLNERKLYVSKPIFSYSNFHIMLWKVFDRKIDSVSAQMYMLLAVKYIWKLAFVLFF